MGIHKFVRRLVKSGISAAALMAVMCPLNADASLVGAGSSNIIMVGDSRTEGMYYAMGQAGCTWQYATGMGYNWMTSTAIPQIDAYVGNGTSVVIMLGVNDIGSTSYATQYASYLNSKAAEWKARGADTYYVSVTKCADGYAGAYGVDNSHIEAWNSQIQQDLSEDVIYLNADAMLGIPSTTDGVHYTADSYATLFNYVYGTVYSAQMSKSYSAQNITNVYTEETEGKHLVIVGDNNLVADKQETTTSAAENTNDKTEPETQPRTEAVEVVIDDSVTDSTYATISGDDDVVHAGAVEGVSDNETLVEDTVATNPDGSIQGVSGSDSILQLDPTLGMTISGITGSNAEESSPEAEPMKNNLIPDEPTTEALKITVLTPDVVGQELIIDEELETETEYEPVRDLTPDEVAELFGYQTENNEDKERPDAGSMLSPHISTAADSEDADHTPEQTGWVESEDGTQYFSASGTKATGIEPIDGKTYYFDANGYLMLDALCYLDNGTVLTDKDGVLKTGWQSVGERKYYFGADGIACVGVTEIDGALYCFAADGALRMGAFVQDGVMYIADEDGMLQNGWVTLDSIQYYCENGVATTGLKQIDGSIYRFDEMGAMSVSARTGEDSLIPDETEQVLMSDEQLSAQAQKETEEETGGHQAENNEATADEIEDDMITIADFGDIAEGWHQDDNGTYYVNAVGDVLTSWQKIAGKTYYMDQDGYIATGLTMVGEGVWLFDENGVLDGSLQDGPLAEVEESDLFEAAVYVRALAAQHKSSIPTLSDVAMDGDTEKVLNAYYDECFVGDIFDQSKVHVSLTDENGVGTVVNTYTIGDVSAAPTVITGDIQMTVVTPYGETQMIIHPQSKEESTEVPVETVTKLVAWYEGKVYEGDTLLRSAFHVVGKTDSGSWQTLHSYDLSENALYPVMESTEIEVTAGDATTHISIDPIAVRYVEAYIPFTPVEGGTIDPKKVVFGYTDGTYRKVSIDECVFGIAPSKKKLVAGANYYPLLWNGKEYTMVASASEK